MESVVQYLLSGGAAVFERSTLLDETNIEALGTHVKHFNRVLHAQVRRAREEASNERSGKEEKRTKVREAEEKEKRI